MKSLRFDAKLQENSSVSSRHQKTSEAKKCRVNWWQYEGFYNLKIPLAIFNKYMFFDKILILSKVSSGKNLKII